MYQFINLFCQKINNWIIYINHSSVKISGNQDKRGVYIHAAILAIKLIRFES